MPYIRMRALEENQVAKVSLTLKKELAAATNTAENSWVIELMQTTFFEGGSKTESSPFIEVLWMPRPQESQDLCAKVITENLKKASNLDCFILFQNAPKETFYKNGVHF